MDLIKGNVIKVNSKGKIKMNLKAKQGMILKRWKSSKITTDFKMFRY